MKYKFRHASFLSTVVMLALVRIGFSGVLEDLKTLEAQDPQLGYKRIIELMEIKNPKGEIPITPHHILLFSKREKNNKFEKFEASFSIVAREDLEVPLKCQVKIGDFLYSGNLEKVSDIENPGKNIFWECRFEVPFQAAMVSPEVTRFSFLNRSGWWELDLKSAFSKFSEASSQVEEPAIELHVPISKEVIKWVEDVDK